MRALADQASHGPAEHGGAGLVDERDAAFSIEPADPFARRSQDHVQTSVGRLAHAPGDDADHARRQQEPAVDARPEPGRGEGRRVVVDVGGKEHADDPVMQDDVGHGQQERHPVLVERENAHHDEEVEMHLDVAAGQVHEHRRRRHQTERGDGGAHAASKRWNRGDDRGRRDRAAFEQRVPATVAEAERDAGEAGGVKRQQRDDRPVPPGPDAFR